MRVKKNVNGCWVDLELFNISKDVYQVCKISNGKLIPLYKTNYDEKTIKKIIETKIITEE